MGATIGVQQVVTEKQDVEQLENGKVKQVTGTGINKLSKCIKKNSNHGYRVFSIQNLKGFKPTVKPIVNEYDSD